MRVRVSFLVVVLVWSGLLLNAQGQKITTPEQLDKAMKVVGPAMQGVNKAVKSAAYVDARKQLAAAKQALSDASSFWVHHKKEDAQKFSTETLAKVDALDKILAAPTVDAETANTIARDVGVACRNCHQAYRVQVDGVYSLKPGSIGGN